MNRAYSIFEIKSIDDEQRVIEGIATTPTTDRVGDIVEPRGAKFTLPLPLLWQHRSSEPIGHVVNATVSDSGITIRAKFPRIEEVGTLKARLDEAWQSIKHGLVRGLSIGFVPAEDGSEPINPKEPWGGQRFTSWSWLELSAVTIPANAEASIQTIKSIDREVVRAASGAPARRPVLLVKTAPGVTGSTAAQAKGSAMKTFKDQIKDLEATRAAKLAELEGIQNKATGEGRTKDAAEKERFDTLKQEIDGIDVELKDLAEMERINVAKAVVIQPGDGTDPAAAGKARAPAGSGVRVEAKLEPGVRFARMAMAMARAGGQRTAAAMEYEREKRWMDTAPEVAMALKTAVLAGDTTTTGWASELVYAQNIATEFIEFLRPQTIIGRMSGWRNVPFNIRVGSQTAGATGYWVGQGKPVPVSKLTTSSVSLGIAKVAGLVAIDDELARSSSPSAELMVRNDLARECQKVLDLSLIDPNQGGQTNIQPASLTYGVTPITPTGVTYATFVADWKNLTSTMIAANLGVARCWVIMSEVTAQALSMMVTSLGNPQFPGLSIAGGTLNGLPVLVSNQATIAGSPQYNNIIVLVNPGEVFLADDGAATVEASTQTALQMDDAPTNASAGSIVATSMVSMFQTSTMAIKAIRYINWAKARSQACAWIQNAAYTG